MSQIHGGDSADTINGGADADELWGGGGSDVIHGGAGNDALYADRPYTEGDLGSPNEATSVNFLYGEAGNDFIVGGVGKDTLDGGDGDDTINGGTGDTLLGGDGADWLSGAPAIADGGAGDDRIDMGPGGGRYTGGSGADRFTLISGEAISRGVATITDFNAVDGDRLSLGGAPYAKARLFRGALDNPNFSLKAGDVFSASRDYGSDLEQVWTWSNGADTYVIADRDGSRTFSDGDIVMRLAGVSSVTAAAFVDGSFSTTSSSPKVGTDGADTFVGTYRDMYYFGLAGDDVIRAGDINSQLHGGPGNDQIKGSGGADLIWGGDGDDLIDGGGAPFGANDFAMYSGASTDYLISRSADGALHVQDLKGRDGLDTLINVSRLQFTDRMLATGYGWDSSVELAFKSVLRAPGEAPSQLAAVLAISDWVTTYSPTFSINRQIVKAADATTSVASMAYQFFTGKVPGEAGIDYLVSPTGPNGNNLNSAYYQSFNLENRYINFAVNLGKNGEGKDAFTAKYGALTLFDTTREVYKAIFGAAPTDAKIHAMIDSRVDYFAVYGGDGANGIGTKAAMVGWLLAEAVKADLGVMARSNDAWLMDLADGSAPFAIDILDPAKGYYKTDFIFGGT